jgi:hypothetical protein
LATPATRVRQRVEFADVGARCESAIARAGQHDRANLRRRLRVRRTRPRVPIIKALSALSTLGRLSVTVATLSVALDQDRFETLHAGRLRGVPGLPRTKSGAQARAQGACRPGNAK